MRRTYEATASIAASKATIWALLTDAAGYPRWNTTIDRLEGRTREDFDGWLAWLIVRTMPDLQPSFDEFAASLKRAAEVAR